MLINTDTLQFIVGTSYSSHCVDTLCLNSLLLMGDTLFLSWCVCVCVCVGDYTGSAGSTRAWTLWPLLTAVNSAGVAFGGLPWCVCVNSVHN